MAIIKSYTDLEQSKKLAKILPFESADMRYGYIAPYDYSDRMFDGGYDDVPYPKDFLKKNPNFSENEYDSSLPCWSLSALLDALPNPKVHQAIGGHWCCECWKNSKDVKSDESTYIGHTKADNIIDACVEMIIRLNELNLL